MYPEIDFLQNLEGVSKCLLCLLGKLFNAVCITRRAILDRFSFYLF